MELNVLATQNWSRAFSVWIEDIQVVCHPGVPTPFELKSSLLRKARFASRYTATVVMLLFALHCTRPQATPQVPVMPAEPTAAEDTAPRADNRIYQETGQASWYGGEDGFAGRPTANGEVYDPADLTCAHRTLPFGTSIEVKNLETGRKAVLRVNDRGPFVRGRMLDVSEKAAKALGMTAKGTARVRIRTVDGQGRPAPLEPVPAPRDPYTVQVASLSDPANIARLSKELQAVVGPVSLVEAHTKGGVVVKRVRVGSFDRIEDAEKAAEQIAKLFKDRGLEPFITREQ